MLYKKFSVIIDLYRKMLSYLKIRHMLIALLFNHAIAFMIFILREWDIYLPHMWSDLTSMGISFMLKSDVKIVRGKGTYYLFK